MKFNPKDAIGAKKVSISKLPPIAILHGSHAMMNGAKKFGAYNWRKEKVRTSIYVDAAIRHLLTWFEGEEIAPDSKVHHLGHALANCAILLDAQAVGTLHDDRPKGFTKRYKKVLDALHKKIIAESKKR